MGEGAHGTACVSLGPVFWGKEEGQMERPRREKAKWKEKDQGGERAGLKCEGVSTPKSLISCLGTTCPPCFRIVLRVKYSVHCAW